MTWGRAFLRARSGPGKKFLVTILLLSLVSARGQFWGTIGFNNRSLRDPATGEIYDAPIFRLPGEPWGAVAGAYAELALVVGEGIFYPLGRTTFRTNSAAAMPYLNPIVLEVPGHRPGSRSLTFIVRLYPGLFGQPSLDSAPFTISTPLGGVPPGGDPPLVPPSIDGFKSIGCSEAARIVPERALYVVGEDVQLQLVPAVPMFWSRITPTYAGLLFASSSLSFTNVQETDAGVFTAQAHCPGILTLGPFVHLSATFVVPADGSYHQISGRHPAVLVYLAPHRYLLPSENREADPACVARDRSLDRDRWPGGVGRYEQTRIDGFLPHRRATPVSREGSGGDSD